MNWPGLLKWSLSYQDGTVPSESMQMSPEQQKWLKEALESVVINEVKEMKVILQQLESELQSTPTTNSETSIQLVESLLNLLQNSDSAINFCKVGGPILMLDMASNKSFCPELRAVCCQMIAESTQNNHYVQDFMTKLPFCDLQPIILDAKSSSRLVFAALGALSAILKGNNLVNKRLFVSQNGVQFLLAFLESQSEEKSLSKGLSILSDILYFKSHLAFDILTVSDQNQLVSVKEELVVFRDTVGHFEAHIFAMLINKLEAFLSDNSPKKHFLRFSYVDCLKAILENEKKEGCFEQKKWNSVLINLRVHFFELEKLAKDDDFYEVEVTNLRNLFDKVGKL